MIHSNFIHSGSLAGRYRIQISDAKSGVLIKDSGWSNNVITNYGLNSIGKQEMMFYYCRLGSGTATPSVTDVGVQIPLGNPVSVASATNALITDTTGTYMKSVLKFNFPTGGIVGTIREVAVGYPDYNTTMQSRSLLKVGGVPVELVSTNTDLVSVEYELRNYINTAEENYQQVINNVTYDVNSKLVSTNSSYYYGLGTSNYSRFGAYYINTSDMSSGYTTSFDSGSNNTYVSNSFEATATYTLNNGTARSISAIQLHGSGNCLGITRLTFTPPIQKLATQKMTFNFKYKWGRYEGQF